MSNNIHMGGLVSGTDVQGIIDQLMALEVRKITTIQNERIDIEADASAWNDVAADMSTLTDSLYTLGSYDTWNKMDATA